MAHLFVTDDLFGMLRVVVFTRVLDHSEQKFADHFCDGGFAVDGVDARSAIETVIDRDGDIRHIVTPEEVTEKENGPAAWAAGPWFFSAYF
jgi:hypothetical protein